MTGRPYRILIIDDSAPDRAAYRQHLSRGCEDEYVVVEAETAAQGLALVRGDEFDCVLLDANLPDRDLLPCLDELVPNPSAPRLAVIVMAQGSDEPRGIQAMKKGAQDYLLKESLSPGALRRAVHNSIERVALLRRIEEQRRELERLATIDTLTGLYNRRYFTERLDQEVARVRRYGLSMSVLMLDVDKFKEVNDTFGHLAGDRALSMVGQVLRSALRRTDFAARYGGEEFCILAVATDIEGAESLAERIRKLIAAQPFSASDGGAFRITVSIGVAQLTPEMRTGTDLLAAADAAMYQAKSAGRNCVRRFTPSTSSR